MIDIPDSERVHASAVTFLTDGHEEKAARILLSCDLEVEAHYVWLAPDEGYNDGTFDVELAAPRAIYEIISNAEHPTTKLIEEAIRVTLNRPYHLDNRLLLPKVTPGWKEKMLDALQENSVVNQGNPIENRPTYSWNNLRFRSNTEIKIAEALDKAGVLFFPNCMARLGPIGERRNKEADFLICDDGKWGILEIDGEAYHSNAATDHERDRFFRTYGIRVIERFTASQCYNNPEAVIRRFLVLLKKNA